MARKPTEVTTGEVRLSYEHLLKPYSNQPNAEPKYSAALLIPKTDIATKQRIDAAIQAAIVEGTAGKWNGARPVQPHIPIHDGDGLRESGEPFGEECKGHWVMTASSKLPQEIIDISGNPLINSTDVYSGMYARVFLKFYAYNQAGKKGIGCGLGPVQKTRDGEPLGGKVTAVEAFGDSLAAAYTAPANAPDPAYLQSVYQSAPAPTAQYPQPAYAAQQIDPLTGLPVAGIYGLQ